MKAIVYTRYGSPDVLHPADVEKPAPKAGEVLIKIHAASLNAYDLHFLRADPFLIRLLAGGFFKPIHNILGADVAGRVEAAGAMVTRFKPGDEVLGDIGSGGLAEYACAKENQLVLKPAGMSFEEAAALPMAALTALQGLRDQGRIQAGQKVLINGAGGGVGTFAVQIAKAFGAEVTAVCGPANLDLMRSLGADDVMDYTKEDFTKKKERYDLILAANGYHSIFAYRKMLSPAGRYVMAGGTLPQMLQAIVLGPRLSETRGRKLGTFVANIDPKDLEFLKGLYDIGKVKPIIDRRFPLKDAAEAFRYMETGHVRGKVVIIPE